MVMYGIPQRRIRESEKRISDSLNKSNNLPDSPLPPPIRNNQLRNSETIIELSEKQTAYKILREEGLPIKDAAQALGYAMTTAYGLDAKFRKYAIKGNEKLLKQASKSLNHLVKGERFGDVESVKCSTVLAAVNAVYDRHEPVIKQTFNINSNIDLSPVDLDKYRGDRELRNSGTVNGEGEGLLNSEGVEGGGERVEKLQ